MIPKGSISPVWLYVALGALFLLGFFLYTRSRETKGRDVLLPLRLFRNKVSNLRLALRDRLGFPERPRAFAPGGTVAALAGHRGGAAGPGRSSGAGDARRWPARDAGVRAVGRGRGGPRVSYRGTAAT